MCDACLLVQQTLVLRQLGEATLDPFRSLVLKLMSERRGWKKAELQAEAVAALGAEVPTSVYNKVLKELCVTKSGGEWQLKSSKIRHVKQRRARPRAPPAGALRASGSLLKYL